MEYCRGNEYRVLLDHTDKQIECKDVAFDEHSSKVEDRAKKCILLDYVEPEASLDNLRVKNMNTNGANKKTYHPEIIQSDIEAHVYFGGTTAEDDSAEDKELPIEVTTDEEMNELEASGTQINRKNLTYFPCLRRSNRTSAVHHSDRYGHEKCYAAVVL